MPTLAEALGRPILFVGGKGGVGKTTVAAGVALAAAATGRRTLLVSTDPAHSAGDALAVSLGPQPTRVEDSLWALELDPESETDRYMDDVRSRIEEAAPPRLMNEVESQLEAARSSPGAEEAAVFDRFTRILDAAEYDRIVFDTAPSGHTLRLLSLPEAMTGWLDSLVSRRRKVSALGKMWRNVAGDAAGGDAQGGDAVLEALEERRDRFKRSRSILVDPQQTSFVFVTLAERLPILETHRIFTALAAHAIPVGGVIVNQVLPADTRDPFLRRRREKESLHLADIRHRFGDWPIGYLPLMDDDPVGAAGLADLLQRLHTARPEEA